MRIIAGHLKGLRLKPPKRLPVRPTTNYAKEALFNILSNYLAFEKLRALDLFCGTGNITLELVSRNALSVTAIDQHRACVHYVKNLAKQHLLHQVKVLRLDVFHFLNTSNESYDLIFADPPYQLGNLIDIPRLVFARNLINKNGVLVVEHPSCKSMSQHSAFVVQRSYGGVTFSFFKDQNSSL